MTRFYISVQNKFGMESLFATEKTVDFEKALAQYNVIKERFGSEYDIVLFKNITTDDIELVKV